MVGRICGHGRRAGMREVRWQRGLRSRTAEGRLVSHGPLLRPVDFWGNALTSSNPSGGQNAWSILPIDNGFTDSSIACPSRRLCVDANGYGASLLISTDPTSRSSWTTNQMPSQFGVSNARCPLLTLCYAADDSQTLISSTPATAGSWTLESIGAGGIAGLSCPAAAECIALDASGKLLIGIPAPSPAATRARLSSLLRELGTPPTIIRRLGRRPTLSFDAPSPGTLTFACYVPLRAGRVPPGSGRLLAFASVRSARAARERFTVILTRASRTLWHSTRLPLIVTTTFTPTGKPTIRLSRRYAAT